MKLNSRRKYSEARSRKMADDNSNLDIDHLPSILRFNESEAPQLIEAHKRIVETAKTSGPDKADAVANTYEELADEYLRSQHLASQESLAQRTYRIAKGGMLINLVNIWHEAGLKQPGIRRRFLEALDRAISYAHNQRWLSIVTVLENEKQKQLRRSLI